MADNPGINKRARIRARRNAVQALYEWLLTGKDAADVIAEFVNDKNKLAKTDVDYFKSLLKGIIQHNDELNQHIHDLVDRPVNELDAIERAILNIGCYELAHQPELPYRVVVNESVELAKLFGAEGSYKYVNSVLDKVAKKLRHHEIQYNGQ